MAKSRARLVIWCLVLASVGFELAKWRRARGGTHATHVGPHLGGAHHFGSLSAHRNHRVGHHDDDAGAGVHGRIRTHANTHEVPLAILPSRREDLAVSDAAVMPPTRTSQPKGDKSSCQSFPGVEYAGEVVEGGWGADKAIGLASSAAACCARCQTHATCNVWVFCDPADRRCVDKTLEGQCWLKRQTLLRGVAPFAMASGDAVPWTSGADFDAVSSDSHGAFTDSNLETWFKPLDVTRVTPEYGDEVNVRNPRRRECGSPAADAYASVNATCLERSRTAVETLLPLNSESSVVAWHERSASFDGLAVRWGIGHFQPSAAACAFACVRHVPPGVKVGGPFGALPCNAFVWCPVDVEGGVCFEPDAHTHGAGDCWLKFTETPEAPQVNQRERNDDDAFFVNGVSFKDRHPDAPFSTQWTSGVVLPTGWTPSRGTYGPRARW